MMGDQSVSATTLRKWGEDLRVQRENAFLTRKQLASLSGVSEWTIRNVETGSHRPTAKVIKRLVKVEALGLVLPSDPPRVASLPRQVEPTTPPAWRPIETAPRDGTEIFAWCPDVGIRVLIWFGGTWALSGTEDEGRGASCFDGYKPTHWLPLSALPAVPR